MVVSSKMNGATLLVKIIGSVETSDAEILKDEFKKIAIQKPHKVVLDLSKVPAMGSLAIGKILVLFKSLRENKSIFEIQGIHENLYPFFKVMKLDKLFPISKLDASSKGNVQS